MGMEKIPVQAAVIEMSPQIKEAYSKPRPLGAVGGLIVVAAVGSITVPTIPAVLILVVSHIRNLPFLSLVPLYSNIFYWINQLFSIIINGSLKVLKRIKKRRRKERYGYFTEIEGRAKG